MPRHFIIRGTVQGVGYRRWVQVRAEALNLYGWVRNCRDGSVELVAEGAESEIEILRHELHQGPRFAVVEEIEEREADSGELDPLNGFHILDTA